MRMPGFRAESSLYKASGQDLGQVNRANYQMSSASGLTRGVVIPQRCEKACADTCSEECNARCYSGTPPKPKPKPEPCRKICCVDGQPQLT
jgi:hypothetical protein